MPKGFKTKVGTSSNSKLVETESKSKWLSPSVYAQEMSQTTEERLANTYEMHPPRILELLDMSITTHQKFSSLDVDQPLFQPYPSEIVFQNFLPSEMYKVPLVLRNNDKIPRLVKVVVEDSLYFKVISTEDVGSKVAPGLTCTFTVLFTPQENKDYIHRLICVTERETFEVPIRAIGVRAILDFPDQVHFPPCPVKGLTQKTLLVRNIGNGEANFQLSTQRPFSVEPAVGTLGGGHSMQVTIDFLPRVTGDHSQQLLLHYHTGEDVYISLYGTSIDVSVRLDRNSVLVEKTYITMANQRRVAILNRSDTIVHYQWKSFATEDEEEQHRLRFCSELQPEEDNEMEQILTEGDTDLTLRDHLFQQRRRQLHQDSLVFSDQHIIMEPQEGDIWPKQTAEINIIFKPQEARLYQEIVYCDITGREARLPLRIKAEGIGPKLQFNFVELDMKNVFIGSKNCYEVLVSNKGLIDAPYRLVPPSTAMGLCFSFNPAEGMVPPGACHALEVCFSSDNLGIFSEEFYFMVEGNPQPLSLTFRGCVIGPTFHFSVSELNFGEMSFGFPQTLTCRLSNTSLVPMSFGMRIPGDGMGKDSVTSSEQVSQFNRNNWRPGDRVAERPQEFKVMPRSGAIRALSHKDIQVTFCSNTVQEYSMSLVVDVEGVGEEVLALPIKARCLVPEVHLERRLLEFQNCFMNYPYQKSVTLINVSDLPACYGLLEQEYEENPSLLFSSPQPRGVIEPCSRVEIPLVLQAKALGQLHHTAFFALLGQQGPPLELLLSCIGQGPAISLSATKLHFGNIPVLTDVPRSLRLSNHSPVPACFHAQMAGSRSQWRVEPAEGKVAPDGHVELRLVAHLDDTLPFQDTLQLVIQDSQTQTVDVSATGTGTTIITDRPFAPSLDLGGHFSSRPCQYHFRVTNRGRRLHQLFWSTEGFPQFHRKSLPLKNTSRNGKAKSPLVTPLLDAPVFTLTPIWLKLDPGESADMLLEGFADTPKVVRERLVCLANVEHETAKKRIMTVDITCQFIAPVLDISSQQLSFYVEKVPDMPLVPLYERLLLKSTSTLPLSMELTLAEPFGLCDHAGDNTFATSKSLVLGVGAEIELWVRFDPSYQSDLVSRVAEVVLEVQYSGHPKRDYVALRGEVHFPNVHFSSSVLDFGCVLNHTEAQQQITMTNCSPLPVSYHWTFLLDQQQICIRQIDDQKAWMGKERPKEKEDSELDMEERVSSSAYDRDLLELDSGLTNGQDSSTPHDQGISTASPTITASVGVQEVFDISPIFGVLRPGESQLVTFSFFGNPDISAEVLALCQVEHGPTYEIILRGEASLVTYALDTTDINLGYQLFDRVSEAEVTIKNTGRVGFDFSALLDDEQLSSENPLPGQPLVIPSKGHIEANTEMRLTVYYLPGIPEVFEKTFLLQVAFFEPEVITLRGEGIFPRVVLDLPRDLDKEQYNSVVKEAKEAMESERQREEALSRPATGEAEICEEDYIPTYDALLQMEVERLLVKEHAITTEKSQRDTRLSETSISSSKWYKKPSRFVLPEYVLDFGFVIHGSIHTHIVKVTNTGPAPVSFRAKLHLLAGTGFSTELDRVKNLPYCETETFEVKFDPLGANLELGEITTILPIQVLGGPMVQVRLRAVVTMPSLTVSTDVLQFDNIQCGLCQVVTVQLHNPEQVPCEWSFRVEEQPKKKPKKIVPLRLRQKARFEQLPSPAVFEMLPSKGVLYPGDRVNVQVKFSPTEGRAYKEKLVVAVAQSTQRILLLAQGHGEEPQLEFSTSLLELGPVLPYSAGEEAEVVVRNLCHFPIEFYSLDFDTQYLEEEKILRMMKGYDAQNMLLLPPRAPGQPLPAELLDYYKEHQSQEPEQDHTMEERGVDVDAVAEPAVDGTITGAEGGTVSSVGDLEMDPVSRAIARHVGIDLSPDGQAARNRRGIAIIVHGAPLSGKSSLAVSLAKQYGAACLNIDGVVQEVVSSGVSTAAMQARELCGTATVELTQGTLDERAPSVSDVLGAAGLPVDVLSVEAVARHTAEDGQANDPKPAASSISTHNKTITTEPKRSDGYNPTAVSMAAQVQRRPSESVSLMGEMAAISSLLPDDLLIEILSERLQLSDCHCGVVIDSLETLYCCSPSSVLQIVLKAFNNRKHIYVIDLNNNYHAFKAEERARVEAAESLQREQIEREQLRLQEMDEYEYDALPEEQKERINLLHLEVLREHKQREQERLEQEARKQLEELERLREEEEMKKKNKKGKKELLKEDSSGKRNHLVGKQSASVQRSDSRLDQHPKEDRKMSHVDRKDSRASLLESSRKLDEGENKKKDRILHEDSPLPLDDMEGEMNCEADRHLLYRFRLYEQSLPQIQHVLQHWDRTQGLLLQSFSSEEQAQENEEVTEQQVTSGKKNKKEREKEKVNRERQEKEKQKVELPSTPPSQTHLLFDDTEATKRELIQEIIPLICISASEKELLCGTKLLSSLKLPSLEEVLDSLGLGPSGPPIPPPMLFSVVPYPKTRPLLSPQNCFALLVPPSLAEVRSEADLEVKDQSPIVIAKDELASPSRGKVKKALVKEEPPKENAKEKRRSAAKKGVKSADIQPATVSTVTPLPKTDQSMSVDSQSERGQRLTHFRWLVPAKGEVTLRICFNSTAKGSFEQTLSFEVMGTKRCYQLCLRGICDYPSISKDHKTVFAHCKKVLQPEDGLQKTYIVRSGLYDFGPVLCGKNRDRYKEKYPENTERLVIHNNSPLEAEVNFLFQHDTKATTFFLDPPSMVLKPKEKKELTVLAYPTSPGLIEDSVVCCIKENPEPVIFRFVCRGVRPELEVERRQLHFDKTLLHRRETRSLCLRNPTALPVAWKLSGLEVLGDEFSVSQDHGVIMPQSEFSLNMYFKAVKSISLKKTIHLEVSDVGNILGLVHTENIQVIAEAYDVALDTGFPQGGLDFGSVKVGEEVKISTHLKNKGKYEIAYMFMLEPTEPNMPDLNSVFTITPQRGSLLPSDRPTTVQFIFCHNREVSIRDQPILKCQVIEPNVGGIVAVIPINVSAQCLFSKYSITPPNSVNFGALVYGSRKTRNLTVENLGEFEIRFTISRTSKDPPGPAQRNGIGKKSLRDSQSAKPFPPNKLRRADSVQKDTVVSTQGRMSMGVFTVSPCFGLLPPGGKQLISVDCVAEHVGFWHECLAVDITDRDPSDSPGGISYSLVADICVPEIASKDIASIFEEHRLSQNSNMLHCEQYRNAVSIFIQEENKFVFNNVLVGQLAKARLRLTNPGKVPCELSLQVKSVLAKTSERRSDAFEVTPTRLSIASYSHDFVTITFCPQAMQTYLGVFEATLEGASGMSPMGKSKVLVFDLLGDGNLPSITVVKPVQRTSQGQPVLQFNRLLVGSRQTLPLVIKNISSVPAQISFDLLDKMGVFGLRSAPNTTCTHVSSTRIGRDPGTATLMAHVASLTLKAGQQAEFEVQFCPEVAQSFNASLRLVVQDNHYEVILVQLLGEGYHDIISLDNISNKFPQDQESTEAPIDRSNLLNFGDCHVSCLYNETFTMSNHSNIEVIRFEWPPDVPQLRFSPRIGHLHAGCTKEVTVSFISEQPVVLSTQVVKCKLSRITFQQPVDQVPDWDDRRHTIKWVDADRQALPQQPAKKKVVETDPEPDHTVVDNSSRELELTVSAVCDYAQFECQAEPIHFKDTTLYQTRVFQMQLANKGTVKLEYVWQVMLETSGKTMSFNHGERTRTGPRPSSSLASVSALLLGNPDLPPFSVEPSVGIIKPGATETFCVRFCPLEIAEYEARLHCSIPNLKEGQGLTITASGLSLLPYCHFHLKDSDYLSGNRRSPDLRVALDPNTKVVEFSSTGINTVIYREFSIVNPTNKPYSFLWKCEDTRTKPFTCLTPKNTIQPGKKVEVSFKFHPQELDLVESFWTFLIPEHKLSVPFLLVGTANEPVVYIDHAHLNLGSLLIGQETRRTVYMVNGEDQPFSFSILDVSCRSEPLGDSLLLETMEGTVSPRDKLPLVISFTPTQEGAVMFNLLVTVTGRVQPLTLNIKAEGYSMNASVHCKGPEGALTKLSSTDIHIVDFKTVELSETSTCSFVVYNPGKFSLDVRYELTGPTDLQRHLQVDPKTAIVPVGRQDRCILSFFPLQNCILKDMRFSIRVKNGATFCCSLLGAATAPGLEFSFLKYNFGMNFIYSAGMVPATHTLVISNKGEKGISVNCLFSNTPSLKASFTPEVLPPGGSMEVLFTFYPREAVQYHEKVVFEINKCAKQVVEILGQGIAMKIDVEDPQHKVVKLGALQVGQKCRKLIPLINNSDSYLTFSLLFTPTAHALLDPGVFSMRPEREVTLPGRGGRCKVEVVFTPQQRMAPFSEELQLKCLGTVCPLLVLKGCCHGVEVTLDQGYLRFGAVCRNCKATRRIILQNTGDIGARFEWDVQSFAPDFSICPAKGYITPGMELPLEVTFAPVEVKQNVRYDNLCCSIEGGKPVTITLAGSCIPPQVANQVLNFACQVRSQCTQSLSLSNPSNQSWNLQPVLEGEYWSAAPFFVVEPYQQNKAYEITYEPMTMTTDGKKHLGSVFFAFPDGAGMLYTLQGTTEPPKAVGTISGEVPCKTLYTEMIPVQNWLHKPQRFRVLMEMVNPDRPDNTVSLKGLDYMDVPALAKRDYKISFFSYKEGQYNAKVTFKNEVTGEYLFYNLSFKATPPGVMSTVEMVASVRQTTSACVEVENPLPTNVVFSVECRSPDISVQSQLSVSALSKDTLKLQYQPLCIGESTTRLTLQNSELGSFHYELLLRALPAPPEKPLYFKAPLGSSQYLTAKFTSYSRVKTEYTCKTDCPDFFVEKTVSAAAAGSQTGSDVSVKVHFEPSQLGEVRGLLTVSSSLGGDYLFPLYGTCTPPKPQGPLTIYAGSHVTIPFKNVFPQAAAFSFQVNNPAFTVKGADTIPSKKTHNIVVSFEGPPEGSKTLCTGKLTISSPRTDGHGQAIFWVYYLKGICPEQPQREK
ncbi:hydrocephalus-inducing protein homolog isoform X2 [Astyanax mexicanus]|uniref:hydrocephalus-inducing protein homolog isoform X2 n=1 Tax=Astyanax mexicanus TaxID=7994 RepID=UPI0020CAEBA5|nr:hydrocephalus-inducing protein homolog isoform X2 [Astyanax mexicanus]